MRTYLSAPVTSPTFSDHQVKIPPSTGLSAAHTFLKEEISFLISFFAAIIDKVTNSNQMDFHWRINLFLLICRTILAEVEDHCPRTTTLKNGKVTFQSRGGVTAIYTCDSNFTLHGSNVSHCQTDGHWSSPPPTCGLKGQKCSPNIEILTLSSGHSVNISCSKDGSSSENQHFWTGNGKFIESNKEKISVNNSGLYICISYNKFNVKILKAVRVSLIPQVLAKSEKCIISFRNKTTSILTSFSNQLSLSCETNSNSVSVSWFKDGKPINNANKTFLNIHSMQSVHEGNYTCLVHKLGTPDCFIQKNIKVKMRNNLTNPETNFPCGQPIMNTVSRWKRVIDGSRAVPLSAPWMGMLSMNREPPFCGCSLISDKWIVTAAHCFKSKNISGYQYISQEEIRRKVFVKFGKYFRRQTENTELIRGLQNLIIHPKFQIESRAENFINEHDIALGKLNEPIIFQKSILPICLPPPGFTSSVPSGTLGVVTGWGKVSVRDSVMALTLQEAYLPLVNNSSCQQTTSYIITDNMLCAGYAESFKPDTCSGDSGGPFIIRKGNAWYLVGVISWGEGCSTPKKFGVYTKVEKYVSWIQSITDKKFVEDK